MVTPIRSFGVFLLSASMLAGCTTTVLQEPVASDKDAAQPAVKITQPDSAVAQAAAAPTPAKAASVDVCVEDKVRNGEAAITLFSRYMSEGEFLTMRNAVKSVYDLKMLRAGNPYKLVYREKAGLKSFTYRINRKKVLDITRNQGSKRYSAVVRDDTTWRKR